MPVEETANNFRIRQARQNLFDESTFKTVPITRTSYSGKYRKKGVQAVVGKKKSNGKWGIQTILVPKHLYNVKENPYPAAGIYGTLEERKASARKLKKCAHELYLAIEKAARAKSEQELENWWAEAVGLTSRIQTKLRTLRKR